MTEIRYLSKQETQGIDCPHPGCGAPAGQPCFAAGERGTRARNHALRVNAAAAALEITLPHQRGGQRYQRRRKPN